MQIKPLIIAATAVASLAVTDVHSQTAPVQRKCDIRAWINAFDPAKPVFPRVQDVCPADLSRPVFTREGALACATRDGFRLAYNAMTRGWRYVPTAGVELANVEPGAQLTPEALGCTIHHDGVPARVIGSTFSAAQTDIGWVHTNTLRNAFAPPPVPKPLRPKLCDKTGQKCVYTDVRPFEPVQAR